MMEGESYRLSNVHLIAVEKPDYIAGAQKYVLVG